MNQVSFYRMEDFRQTVRGLVGLNPFMNQVSFYIFSSLNLPNDLIVLIPL